LTVFVVVALLTACRAVTWMGHRAPPSWVQTACGHRGNARGHDTIRTTLGYNDGTSPARARSATKAGAPVPNAKASTREPKLPSTAPSRSPGHAIRPKRPDGPIIAAPSRERNRIVASKRNQQETSRGGEPGPVVAAGTPSTDGTPKRPRDDARRPVSCHGERGWSPPRMSVGLEVRRALPCNEARPRGWVL
jgi:hypothetical protein